MKSRYASKSTKGGHKGFGLIEQIVTLMVLAVLTAIAVPNFRRLLAGHELRVAQSDYMAALQHARNLAVTLQTRIILCPSRDGLTCNGDNVWQGGWLIGRDPGGKQQVQGAALYVGGKDVGTVRIVGSERKYFWFKPDGSSAGTNQRLVFCTGEQPARVLVLRVAPQGRVKEAPPDSDDVAKCAAID
jgi:type IV fimbrial biogenesis protein FimT